MVSSGSTERHRVLHAIVDLLEQALGLEIGDDRLRAFSRVKPANGPQSLVHHRAIVHHVDDQAELEACAARSRSRSDRATA
jgi:hypothetical protein